ncbi:response regulator [Duganella sp. FT50W]|uniref:Response regulator n=1 Tax=Duganella lactea TaxID=2692173 RepID=A0A6L8MD77_9BURK|nr:response regulator [Duganella lactea]MYM80573.1 response regulator [Duganella lactea]
MMILIVEDDLDLAETCSMVLETSNFEVQVAHSAEDALVKIAGRKPDLLISDCVLPGRSGLELSQQMRSRHDTRELPILLMSGSLRNQVAHGDSYDGFINKPFLAEALLSEVSRLLQLAGSAANRSARGTP